ncbi:MAG: 50S ribosomal protein L30 [Prevotellaceae bacterium]|jgi:large subunit ribosomal protein L30|nr:50S ribosomal protein L30 [Prevotellaceae bacterium]
MAVYKITQVRSKIGSTQKQRDTLRTLGLRRINHSVEREMTSDVAGMVRAVQHLVKTEEVK